MEIEFMEILLVRVLELELAVQQAVQLAVQLESKQLLLQHPYQQYLHELNLQPYQQFSTSRSRRRSGSGAG
jgi:hypothetical protein